MEAHLLKLLMGIREWTMAARENPAAGNEEYFNSVAAYHIILLAWRTWHFLFEPTFKLLFTLLVSSSNIWMWSSSSDPNTPERFSKGLNVKSRSLSQPSMHCSWLSGAASRGVPCKIDFAFTKHGGFVLSLLIFCVPSLFLSSKHF